MEDLSLRALNHRLSPKKKFTASLNHAVSAAQNDHRFSFLSLIFHHVEGIQLIVGFGGLGIATSHRITKLGLHMTQILHVFSGVAPGLDGNIDRSHVVTLVKGGIDSIISRSAVSGSPRGYRADAAALLTLWLRGEDFLLAQTERRSNLLFGLGKRQNSLR